MEIAVIVFMASGMAMAITLVMFMTMTMIMTVIMTVTVKHPLVGMRMRRDVIVRPVCSLRQTIVFFKRFVMAVFMASAVSAMLRVEWTIDGGGMHPKKMKHLCKHGVVLKLQIVLANFHSHVPIAQVVRSPGQVDGRICSHAYQCLVLCAYADQAAIIRNQNIPRQQDLSALDEQVQRFTIIQ